MPRVEISARSPSTAAFVARAQGQKSSAPIAFALLGEHRSHGSISHAAAKDVGLSYKAAWDAVTR